ncbi:MAG TPA: hypothetical protein VIZ43_16460 [Trebonia sp.]
MPTVTVPRDVTSQEVVEALREGLDRRYEVLPETLMPRSPLFGGPQQAGPDLIMVAAGPMVRAQVKIIHRTGRTDLRITPGGLLGDLLMNTLGVAREVRQALLDAPGLDGREAP